MSFNHEPFYVGKGHDNRVLGSMTYDKAIVKNSTYKAKKISKIRREGHAILFKIAYNELSESDAFEFESYLIQKIGRHNLKKGSLTNLTNGGEGESGRVWTKESKERLAKSVSQVQANMTDEQRLEKAQKLSDAHYARTTEAERARVDRIISTNELKTKKEKAVISKKKSETLKKTYSENGKEIDSKKKQTLLKNHGTEKVSGWWFMDEETKKKTKEKCLKLLRITKRASQKNKSIKMVKRH